MTREEWVPLVLLLSNGFKGDFTDGNIEAYFRFLAGYEAVEVEAAIHAYVQTGAKWVPAAPELVELIERRRTPPAPTWAEAQAMFARAHRRFRRNERAAIEGLYGRHPYFGLFAQQQGWLRLIDEPVDDPDFGGAVRKRLAEAWQALVDAEEARRRQGLAVSALRAAGSVNGPRQLRQLDAMLAGRKQLGSGS